MRNLLFFIRNLWRFRKFLWQYRPWEYDSSFLQFNLIVLEDVKRSIIIGDRSPNNPSKIRNINVCLNLCKRLEQGVYLDFYDNYGEMKWERLDNGCRVMLESGITRKAGVPKSASSFKQEQRDWDYLYKTLAKHGGRFWD